MYQDFLTLIIYIVCHSPRSVNDAMNIKPQPQQAESNHF